MKFTCDAKELCGACAEVAKAASVRASVPALEGIRLMLKGNTLTLSGYDLEIGAETELGVMGEEDGAIVTNTARVFVATIAKLKGEIEFSTDGVKISIRSKKGGVEFVGISADDYPNIPEFNMTDQVSGSELKSALSSVSWCIDENATKATAAGAFFKAKKGSCEIVGTNGAVLAICKIKTGADDVSFIIPKKAVKIIADYAGKCENLSFGAGGNLACFGDDTTKIITRTIQGEYINYGRIIEPARKYQDITVNRTELVEILEIVNTVCSEKDRRPVTVIFGSKGIDIKMETSVGRTENHIDCDCEASYTTAFNPRYLFEMLSHSAAEKVKLTVGGAMVPLLINGGDGYEALAMPVRTK